MANQNRPRGFAPEQPTRSILVKPKSTATFKVGDPLVYEAGAGVKVATATNRQIFGVAAEACTSGVPAVGGTKVRVWPADEGDFVVQCSGTATQASHEMANVDMETTAGSGDFEADENASVVETLKILRLFGQPGNDWGLNADVVVRFNFPQRLGYVGGDGTYLGVDGTGALNIKTHHMAFHGQVGGAGTITLKGPCCPVAGTVSYVGMTSDTATSSDGSNYWTIEVKDSAGNSLFSAAWNTNTDGDLVAHAVKDLSAKLAATPTVVKGELLVCVMTETGIATDLSSAQLSLLLDIQAF